MKAREGSRFLNSIYDPNNHLFHSIQKWFNLDFHGYSPDSLQRRLKKVVHELCGGQVDELISKLDSIPDARDRFLDSFTVNVTDFFRDPQSFKTLKEQVLPKLAQKPSFHIWIAGCSTGEEVLSLNILLHEYGILDQANILATDISGKAIQRARGGNYAVKYRAEHEEFYSQAGGLYTFGEYLKDVNHGINLASALMRNVVWQSHDLIKDDIPGKFDLILCRNVLIYFKRMKQHEMLYSFHKHLTQEGYFVNGSQESITLFNENQLFRGLSPGGSVYQNCT